MLCTLLRPTGGVSTAGRRSEDRRRRLVERMFARCWQLDPRMSPLSCCERSNLHVGRSEGVGYKYSIRRPHRASNHAAQSNRCQRATIGGVQRPEGNLAGRSCTKPGATQQTCRGQARPQDEGEQGWVRHEVARRPVVGDAQRRFGRASVAWGHRALPDRAPADHGWDSDRQEPWGKAPDRAGAALLHRRPQAQGPTRAEPDPQGRRRRSRWG